MPRSSFGLQTAPAVAYLQPRGRPPLPMVSTASTLAKAIAECEITLHDAHITSRYPDFPHHLFAIRYVRVRLTKTMRCTRSCNRYVSSAICYYKLGTTGYSRMRRS
jgi:hypothetical protein